MHEVPEPTQDPGWILDPDTGIYEQFAVFHALEPLDLADYADGAAARGIPRRHGRAEFPPLRAALRLRQFAWRGDARYHVGLLHHLGALRPLAANHHVDRHGALGLGALWQAVMLGFAGLDLRGDMLGIDPRLPPLWRSLSFRVCWRGRSVGIRIAGRTVEATLVEGEPIEMPIAATTRELTIGATLQVSL